MEADPLMRWMLFNTAVLHAGFALCLGALTSMLWTREAGCRWAREVYGDSRALLKAAAALSLVAAVIGLWLQSAMMAEVPLMEALPAMVAMTRTTHYGHAGAAGIAALLLVWGAAVWLGRAATSTAFGLALLGLAVFAYTRSIDSHAGAHGDVSAAVAIDWLHLVLACWWAGIVFVGTWVLRRPAQLALDRLATAFWIARLSTAATFALAGIVATGLWNVWRGTEGMLGQVVGSAYGNALFIKVGLVLVAACLGAFNRFRVLPSLLDSLRAASAGRTEGQATFCRALRIESFVLAGVLIAAAFLSSRPALGAT